MPEYEKFFAESERIAPTGRVHHVWDWLPQEKKSYDATCLDTKCLLGIRNSFSYVTKRVDKRRKHMRGTGAANYFTLTGLDMVNCGITGGKGGPTCHPVIAMSKPDAPSAAEAVALEDEPDPGPMECELLRDTREHRGWRTSYSKVVDSVEENRRFTQYLATQMRHLAFSTTKLAIPARRLSVKERRIQQKNHIAQKLKAEKAFHAHFKGFRA